MQERASTLIVGAMMAAFAVLGLVLGAGARDIEMLVFGWSLTVFGVMFIAGLVRDTRQLASRESRHHG